MTRTWLITESSSGIGRALAQAALEAGDEVVATAETPADLIDLTDRYPEQFVAVASDRSADAAFDAVQAAFDVFGGLDVVIDAAEPGSSDVSIMQAALPLLNEQHPGHVIQIASGSGGGAAFLPTGDPMPTMAGAA
jgi:NAD(P)-dependent dehydrogenase (short-subunit alcohol dehydrogenase family)